MYLFIYLDTIWYNIQNEATFAKKNNYYVKCVFMAYNETPTKLKFNYLIILGNIL